MTLSSSSSDPIHRIVVCGGGLAAQMAVAALARQLPPTIEVVWVNGPDTRNADLLMGSLAPPTAYAFNLAAAVSEPRLVQDTDTVFSWGTQFDHWGADRRSWVQCFHLAFPIVGGVLFHHHLMRHGIAGLEPFLLPAVAARQSVFAHPVEKGPRLLARAEYGYQLSPYSYGGPFATAAQALRVNVVPAGIADVESRDGAIAAVRLSNGQVLKADLFVDCTGPDARLLTSLGVAAPRGRTLRAALTHRPSERIGAPCRNVTPKDFGWQSETPLQRSVARLTLYAPESEKDALAAHGDAQYSGELTLGRRAQPWTGNCVAIGHAAQAVEPLTHAPLLLLQREIDRLLTLIPCSKEMSVEGREFNRQSADDYLHAEIFNRALFETRLEADTPYWQAARAEPAHEKLAQKILQFESRGALVAFDLEPFNAEDWTILHHGMGRRPARYDRVADRVPEADTHAMLTRMPRDITDFVKTMPSLHDYMNHLVRYLKQKKL